MKIKESHIRNIVRNILQEALTDKIYHFTGYIELLNILKENTIKLNHSLSRPSDNLSDNKTFYMCFTRNKDSRQGYSRGHYVRIEFDGQKLNQKFSGKAISYWGNKMGKNGYMTKTFSDSPQNETIPYIQGRTENEDRLFSNSPLIYNADKYITRIDVLAVPNTFKGLCQIAEQDINTNHNFNIFYYDNEKDFIYQTDNTISSEEIFEKYEYNKNDKMTDNYHYTLIRALEDIFNVIRYNEYNTEEIKPIISKELKKNQLEQYIPYIIKATSRELWNGDLRTDDLSNLHNLSTNNYKIAMAILQDYCKPRNLHGVNDIIKYKHKLHYNSLMKNGSNSCFNIMDFNKNVSVTILKHSIDSKYNKLIIINPNTTTINDVKQNTTFFTDIKNILFNIKYELDHNNINLPHKSKDNYTFLKYCQYVFFNKPLMSNIIPIMKLFTPEQQSEIFNCITEETKVNGDNIYQFDFINNEQKTSFYQNFIDYNKSLN